MAKTEPEQASLSEEPDPQDKERLREEALPRSAREGGWLPELRGWFSRRWATRRGRSVIAGSAFVAATAAALAIMFVAGVFSSADEHVPPSGVASRPPGVVSTTDPTFQMTATKADAIGVDPDTEFVLASAEDLPVDTVRALLHVEPAVELSVARESAGHYRISAAQPLAPGKVYRFLIEDTAADTPHVLASFAFQTKTPVGVRADDPARPVHRRAGQHRHRADVHPGGRPGHRRTLPDRARGAGPLRGAQARHRLRPAGRAPAGHALHRDRHARTHR